MKKWLVATSLVVMLGGCSQGNDSMDSEHGENHEPSLEVVEVEILNDDQFDPGSEVLLEAVVTQESEPVNDAEEVKFEVWESGLRDEGHMYEGEFTEEGRYEASHVFEEEGIYYMFAHTTARGMHVMPKMKITVGNPDPADVLEDTSSDSMDHEDHNE